METRRPSGGVMAGEMAGKIDLGGRDLEQMARYLTGEFSNQEQAWENPPFFAHIQVAYRPLSRALFSGFGFYVEQAYGGHLEQPYRVAVIALVLADTEIRIQNYRPKEPQRWVGSARQFPQRLQEMTEADLVYLPGCDVIVTQQAGSFVGESEPGQGCCVERQGRTTYLHTRLHLSSQELLSHDRGLDPHTHEQIWGALAGPFRFRKLRDWS